jgi:leucyl-tRNA synthetase
VKGADLVGKRVKAPLAKYDHVYVLPLPTISMGKGTGVVTSVPSDAPDDYMMLWGLQTKPGLRAELGVDEAWVKGFDPVPIIEIPEMGNLSAKFACEELKVASYKEKDKLAQAKDQCYLRGFTDGVCLVGIGKGTKVEAAKPVVKQHMVEAGDAFLYYEPEGEVAARSAPDVQCVVALCDQWLLGYGEEGWKNKVKEHVQSDDFQTYNPKTQHEFDLILDWLKEWGCSRTTGLGTRLPWDPKFVIESLSDSTIYGAFYTIALLLQGEGNLDGSRTGPGGIPADKLNIAAFDYIFLGKPFNKKKMPGLSEAKLKALRKEFEFWYPMDLRVSGKDLIRNHLTMSLYNHQAIWQDPKKMVRSYFCNGWLMIDHKKMSKSTGNFLQLSDALDSYGADASRVCLADCGDSLDDANFERTVANAAVLKLYTFEQWVQQHVPKSGKDLDFAKIDPSTYTTWDKIVLNELNAVIVECANDYDQMRFKAVVKTAFSELLGLKETYVLAVEWPHPAVIYRYMEVILTLMNPITPHFAQFIWQTYVYPRLQESKNPPKKYEEYLINAGWPK